MDLNDLNYNPLPQESAFGSLRSHIIDFIQTFVVFGAIFTLIYLFVAQFHRVSGLSMFPTMHDSDFLITEKVTYRFGVPRHSEIIVLKDPMDESKDFIKRIIAIPGDTVKIESGKVFVNEIQIPETYLPVGTETHGGAYLTEGKTVKAGPNQFLVFGDNRNHSSDSREWGPIKKESIVGRALFRYWPPQTIGLLTDK